MMESVSIKRQFSIDASVFPTVDLPVPMKPTRATLLKMRIRPEFVGAASGVNPFDVMQL
jgi:hypothetical protein